MGYSAEHTAQTRQRIIDNASQLFKKHGYKGVNIDQIMAKSNLTRGGFYAHFKSKDDLFMETIRPMEIPQNTKNAGKDPTDFNAIIAYYLSPAHRDHPESGCPLPAFAKDIGVSNPEARQRYANLFNGFTRILIETMKNREDIRFKDRAIAVLALMIGGIVVARALGKGKTSEKILAACRSGARLLAGHQGSKGTSQS